MMTTNLSRTEINIESSEIILAHDSFTQFGGAERVFEAAQELFPQSDVYTLVVDSSQSTRVKGWKIITSPLQAAYNIYPHFQHLFGVIPMVMKFWKPKASKVLLSFSSSFIKALKKNPDQIHINYCHTPTRFLWIDPEHAYKEIPKILLPIAKLYFSWMKNWDLRAAKRVDFFIANSKEVQARIKTIYNKDSEIIYPFVDINFWKPTIEKKDYFLIAGRLQYAKGLDLVIRVFNDLGWPLHVVGTGRYEQELKKMAKSNITFLGKTSDEVLRDEYSGALGFIYPQFEDFGAMPLEAAACGTPTIGLAKGGSLETIIPGKTGELLNVMDEVNLKQALEKWNIGNYLQENLLNHASKFSKEIFQEKLLNFVKLKGKIS